MKSIVAALLGVMLSFAAYAQEPNDCNMGWAIPPRVDPRNPGVICLPEFGRMSGVGAQYGNNIWPLSDLNHDGLRDWAIGHNLDTIIDVPYPFIDAAPREVLIYHGERGRLPDPFNYERVGPSELASVSWLVASGDWDNSGSTDLAVAVRLIGDTSFGNRDGYDINTFVIFWGDSTGSYSIGDTTRLENGCQAWFGPKGPLISLDIDRDGVDDLLTFGQSGFMNGRPVAMPGMLVWHGHDRKKWGRDGIGRKYDWSWWNAPVFDKIVDADGDGLLDLTGRTISPPTGPASAWVLYGDTAPFLDTSALQAVDLWSTAQCETAVFSDITGDRIPELVALSGGAEQNTVKVFIGLRGQRLAEQFGSGTDPAQPGQERWWGKPWAEVWQPYRIDDYWTRNDALYDFGDADLDGVDDIWSRSWPFLTEYNSTSRLDSLIDAMVMIEGIGAHANLGDIDGSHVPTIAIGTGSVVRFYRMSRKLRNLPYEERLLPPGTGRAAAPEAPPHSVLDIDLVARPSPAFDRVELRWNPDGLSGPATIVIATSDGRELASLATSAALGGCVIPVAELPHAAYLITLRTSAGSATTKVVRR